MQIIFILVEPAVPENIGAAARAVKTMGFDELRLVKPTGHFAKEALWLAHGSQEVLQNAKVYKSFDESVSDLDFKIATTAKKRSVKFDYYACSEISGMLSAKKRSVAKVGIIFGKEESGLDNLSIQKCDLVSYIPMKTKYPSLNLAQSVMVFAYELSGLAVKCEPGPNRQKIKNPAYPKFKARLDELLCEINIRRDSNIYNRILERAAILNDDDIHLLLSILNKI